MVYTSQGYGGYAPAQREKKAPKTPMTPVIEAYKKGDYKRAEAEKLIERTKNSKKLSDRQVAVRARQVLAFSAARRKDMKLARERFTDLKEEAAKLPDKGKMDSQPGVVPFTMEQDGAYQLIIVVVHRPNGLAV